MGAHILAYIQFDDSTSPEEKPFSQDPSVWDLTNDYALSTCKDYRFISAISGIRNDSDKQPLIPFRGLPAIRRGLSKLELEDDISGWLTHSEILSCLAHFGVLETELDPAVADVLAAMRILINRYGDQRVRLVFAIMD